MHRTRMTQLFHEMSTTRRAQSDSKSERSWDRAEAKHNCSVSQYLNQASTVQTDGSFQQHCLPAQRAKADLRFPILLEPSISLQKSENGENRTCGDPPVLGKLVFLLCRHSRPSGSKCLVASVDRLYKWKSFREIGGQLFRVVICKSVVCCNIWTRNTFYSDLFTSRARWNREAFPSVTALLDRPLWCPERSVGCFCEQRIQNSTISPGHSRKLHDSFDHIVQVSDLFCFRLIKSSLHK